MTGMATEAFGMPKYIKAIQKPSMTDLIVATSTDPKQKWWYCSSIVPKGDISQTEKEKWSSTSKFTIWQNAALKLGTVDAH